MSRITLHVTTMDSPKSTAPAPLYSTGKKIIFVGALLIWAGFYLPWFIGVGSGTVISGAEIPRALGWIVLGMAVLIVILPDSFPEFGIPILRTISIAALIVGAAILAPLFLNHIARPEIGLHFCLAGYVLLIPGVLMDFAAAARSRA